ncbi:MAG: hypothetical protein M3O32_11405, partial [Actinomycetota bacterium]|nr:hypothetical protein [Actinomycetota bacterium]
MTTATTLAYRGAETKQSVLDRLAEHALADEIIQGTYWSGGKGCAVGCLTEHPDGGHYQFPARWGIPENIAWLIDAIFEALPVAEAKAWPVRIMTAIPEGTDLTGVWDRWSLWMLTGLIDRAPAGTEMGSVVTVRGLFARAVAGDEPDPQEWTAARSARATS